MKNLYMPRLSFIVPVYNVAPYLRKCVDSLIMQDCEDYEIILVDDGSTDDSGAICDELAAAYENIRVIHQQNGGLSAARNTGLKVAKGEYICFVDSDDYWEENVLGGLLEQVEREKLDVLRFDYQNVRIMNGRRTDLTNEGEYEVFEPNKDPKRDVDYSEEVTDGETFLNERLGPACYAVMFILRRDILYNGGMIRDKTLNEPLLLNDACLFTEGIYFEDVDWTPRMLLRARKVASTPKIVYNYLWRTGSITLPTDDAKRKKVLDDKIRLIRGFQEQSKNVQNPKWFKWMMSFTTMGVLSAIVSLPRLERNAYIEELRSLQVFPLMTKKEKMWTHRLKMQIANISPKLYCRIMKLKHIEK